MTRNVYTVRENDKLDAALELMEEKLVRRLPVVDDNGRLTGIISQADLVSKVATLKVARVMRSVSRRTRKHAAAI
jgi:CBS domain-containing protein